MHLVPVQVATWGPLVFVNVDGKAPPLADVLEDLPARLAPFHCESMRYVMRKEWDIACNWKIYVDNYLEGYHVPVVHPGLHKELDYDNYVVEPRRYFSIQHAPLRPLAGEGERKLRPLRDRTARGRLRVALPEHDAERLPRADADERRHPRRPRPLPRDLRVVREHPPADAATDPSWTKLLAFSDEIQDEDIEICEIVQRNLRSRVYDRGRYSAARENGVHHFHSLLHEFLT